MTEISPDPSSSRPRYVPERLNKWVSLPSPYFEPRPGVCEWRRGLGFQRCPGQETGNVENKRDNDTLRVTLLTDKTL
jgi:hypothetical protein